VSSVSSRRKLLFIICFVVVAAGLSLVRTSHWDDFTRYTTSTYSTGPVGYKALYLTLEELKLPVRRFRQSFRRLGQYSGALVITGPGLTRFRKRDISALEEWVKQGNRVVVCDGTVKTPISRTSDKTRSENPRGFNQGTLYSPSKYLHLSLQQLSETSRTTLSAGLPGMDASARVSVSGANRWNKPSSAWSILLRDSAGPILVSKTFGKGRITALADPSFAANENLGREQNLRLILALLFESGEPAEILFDEFHQGHVMENTLWDYFASSVAAWMVIQAVVGLGFFFFSKRAHYSGRYRSLDAPKGRSSMEYVDSMATVYESCKAAPVALEAIVGRLMGQVSRQAGIPFKRLQQASPRQIALWAGDKDGSLAQLIQECRQAIQSGQDAQQVLSLARRIVETSRGVGRRTRTS
jgi:hypothetical protein